MDTITFTVQGSAAEPYKVTFKKNDSNLSAYCTCPAGENGMYCKHRFRILSGETTGIVDGNENEVALVVAWLSGTDVEKAIREVELTEQRLEDAKKAATLAKKKLAVAFRD
jgi:uncharacterized Zn finger protein